MGALQRTVLIAEISRATELIGNVCTWNHRSWEVCVSRVGRPRKPRQSELDPGDIFHSLPFVLKNDVDLLDCHLSRVLVYTSAVDLKPVVHCS